MAQYIKQEMPNLNGTEEPQVYYRLKTNRNISSKEFVERISRNGSAIDRGEIEGILIRIADYMQLTGLSRTTATLELKSFRQDPTSGITFVGRGSNKVYVKTCVTSTD